MIKTYKKVSDTQVEITTTFDPEVKVEVESVDVLKNQLSNILKDLDTLNIEYKNSRSVLNEQINQIELDLDEITKLGIKI